METTGASLDVSGRSLPIASCDQCGIWARLLRALTPLGMCKLFCAACFIANEGARIGARRKYFGWRDNQERRLRRIEGRYGR